MNTQNTTVNFKANMSANSRANHVGRTRPGAGRALRAALWLCVAVSLSAFASCKAVEDAFADFLPVVGGGEDPPRVTGSSPAPGQRGVHKDSPVILTFNKRIEQQKCIGAFTIQPPLPGVFDFTASEMIFTSSRQFRGGETYIVSLTQDCEDANGVDLEEQYNASFSTSNELSPPFILRASARKNATGCLPADIFQDVYPNTGSNSVDVCRESPIVIQFNESMDRGSVERSVNVIPNLVGAFVWSNNDSRVEFRPRDRLENGITYVVNVAETARDIAENQMTDPITFSFTVGTESERPLVTAQDGQVDIAGCTPGMSALLVYGAATGLRNANGICSGIAATDTPSTVILDFSEDMDIATVDAAFSISPAINGNKTWANNPACGITNGSCGANGSRMTFTPVQPWQNATTYTVSLQPNAADAAGNEMGAPHVFSFTVGQDPNLPRVVVQDGRVGNAGNCTLAGSQLATAVDAVYGIRNKLNVCTSAVPGDTNSPIIIDFNEDMNIGTVDAAFNVSPPINGLKAWAASAACVPAEGTCTQNENRMTFTPNQPWQVGTTYTVSIGGGAQDAAGNQLGAPHVFSFTTGQDPEPPNVVTQDGTVQLAGSCVAGQPALTAFPGTGLRNANGVCSSLVGGNVNSPVVVHFSEDMDISTTDGAFTISPPINGNKVWDAAPACGTTQGTCAANTSRLTFTPVQPWQNATTYTVNIQQSARDAAGNQMSAPVAFSFTIGTDPNLPRVVMQDGRVANAGSCTLAGSQLATALDPAQGLRNKMNVCTNAVPGDANSQIIIDFNEDMNIGSVDAAFNISPGINGSKAWVNSAACVPADGTCTQNENRMIFTPNEPWQVGVTYSVSIAGQAQDAAGNQMGAPHVFSFTTGQDPEPPNVVTQDGRVQLGASCAVGQPALTAFPADGLRNAIGVCSSNVAGNVNSPVIIHFSEDMDISTTDGAFSVSPPLNGNKVWDTAPACGSTQGTCAGNSSRLTFTPIQSWLNATTYTVTINQNARDAAGLTLPAAYSFSFTIGSDTTLPTVTSIQGDVLGDCDADNETTLTNLIGDLCFLGGQQRIRVNFSEAMDPAVTGGAFSISPQVQGAINWLPAGCQIPNPSTCTSMEFVPSQALTLNQQYQITISTNAQDLAGNRLAVPDILYASTGDGTPPDIVAPTINNLSSDQVGAGCDGNGSESLVAGFVNNVCTDNGGTGAGALINVQFSEPMDQAATASAFSISPNVSGIITFAGNNLRFVATQALDPTTQYRVSISNGARDLAGNTVASSFTRFFNTTAVGGYPGVTSINVGTGAGACSGGAATDMLTNNIFNACPNNNAISVVFTEPMNQTATENAFSISPRVDGTFNWVGNVMTLTPDRALDPNRRYEVQLSTQVEDLQGHKLQSAVSGSFIAGGLDATPPTVVQVRFEQPNAGADACVAPPNDAIVGAGTLTNDVCRATPIEIQFSEPMNQGATASAVNITSATYAISWPAPNLMRITPLGSGFDSGSSHNLTVGTGAQDAGGNNIALQFALSFVAENTSPRVDAIGVESHGAGCDSFGDNGTAVGVRTWTAGACWWDADLPIRSPVNYVFQGQDTPCGLGRPEDNFRIIFNKPMDTGATINAIRLRRLSPPIHTIQLGRADWTDGNRVVTLHFAAQEAVNCGGASGFGGGDLDLGPTNTPAVGGLPLYSIEVERSARDASGETLPANFFFVFEGD